MNFIVLGISHHSAAIELRERVAFAPEQVGEALQDALASTGLEEAVILSTCNRTEIYAVTPESTEPVCHFERLTNWMASYHHLTGAELKQCAYHFEAEEALHHVVKVASGLDSMVLGEPQIFGQLKSAYAVSQEAGAVGPDLSQLFPRIFSIAKKVRTDTAIGENPVSVAYAAVDLAGHIFSDLSNCNALLVGAGETVELVARHLVEAGVKKIVIANRTLGRARELAQQFNAEAVLLAEIPTQLETSDIVITSTASQLPILGKGAVEHALKVRKHRPILMVDIAVPRDIESQVGDLTDIYLYSVDDLREIVDENLRGRHSEASKADVLIEEGVRQYLDELRSLGAVDLVRAYRSMAEGLRSSEVQRAERALSRGEDPHQVLSRLSRAITNKLIHAPTAGLKKASAAGKKDVLESARELLGLSDDASLASATPADDITEPDAQSDLEPPPTADDTSRRTLQ